MSAADQYAEELRRIADAVGKLAREAEAAGEYLDAQVLGDAWHTIYCRAMSVRVDARAAQLAEGRLPVVDVVTTQHGGAQ